MISTCDDFAAILVARVFAPAIVEPLGAFSTHHIVMLSVESVNTQGNMVLQPVVLFEDPGEQWYKMINIRPDHAR